MALRLPWWTLGSDFAAVQARAKLGGKTAEEVGRVRVPSWGGARDGRAASDVHGCATPDPLMPSPCLPGAQQTRYLLSEEAAAAAQAQMGGAGGAKKEVKSPQQVTRLPRPACASLRAPRQAHVLWPMPVAGEHQQCGRRH